MTSKNVMKPIEWLKMGTVSMSPEFLSRDVNAGFSGGEKKRNEILQMALLEPDLAILDETDSGLDIDALKTVAAGVNACRSDDNAIILITHYQRLLDYIKPDYVHVMSNGKIVRSGGKELALELENDGYAFLGADAGRPAYAPSESLNGAGGIELFLSKLIETDVRTRGCTLIALLPNLHAPWHERFVGSSHEVHHILGQLTFQTPPAT